MQKHTTAGIRWWSPTQLLTVQTTQSTVYNDDITFITECCDLAGLDFNPDHPSVPVQPNWDTQNLAGSVNKNLVQPTDHA